MKQQLKFAGLAALLCVVADAASQSATFCRPARGRLTAHQMTLRDGRVGDDAQQGRQSGELQLLLHNLLSESAAARGQSTLMQSVFCLSLFYDAVAASKPEASLGASEQPCTAPRQLFET